MLFCYIPIHRFLVIHGQINPWKLGGMAMYTNIHRVTMEVIYYEENGKAVRIQNKFVSGKSLESLDHLHKEWNDLGKITSNKTIRNAEDNLLSEFPQMDSILILFKTHHFPFQGTEPKIRYQSLIFKK